MANMILFFLAPQTTRFATVPELQGPLRVTWQTMTFF